MPLPLVLVTHPRERLATYFGEQALANLQGLARVKLNPDANDWSTPELIEAAQGCDVLIAYRQTALPAEFFTAVPSLLAAVRCAVDIRTIDVAAASREGILVTQASAGFGPAVAEWVIGTMIDLSRRISTSVAAYWQGQSPSPLMGGELRGACIGIIGYGEIGRHVARLAQAFGMRVCVYDPHVQPSDPAIESLGWQELLACADHVVCLATATPATEKLINAQALSCMKPTAFFINASRGQLVDEPMHHGGSWWTSRACCGLWSGGNWQAPLWMWVARQTRCRPLNWRDIPASLPHRMSVVSHRKRLLTKPWKL